jgi:hypothetical protein
MPFGKLVRDRSLARTAASADPPHMTQSGSQWNVADGQLHPVPIIRGNLGYSSESLAVGGMATPNSSAKSRMSCQSWLSNS